MNNNYNKIVDEVAYLVEKDRFEKLKSIENYIKPLSICIRPTRKCNIYCSYCLSSSSKAFSNKYNKTYEILEEISVWAPLRIVWSGGEPFLTEDFINILRKSKQYGFFNIVSTNGTIFYHSDEFNEIIDWLDVCIHGWNRKSYKRVTNYDCFETVLENIKEFKDRGIRVGANCVLTRESKSHVEDYLKLALKVGIKNFKFHRILNIGRAKENNLPILSDNEVLEVSEIIHNYTDRLSIIFPPVKKKVMVENNYFVLRNDGALELKNGDVNLFKNWGIFDREIKSRLSGHYYLFLGPGF